jgi:citrate lyase alpha subunit
LVDKVGGLSGPNLTIVASLVNVVWPALVLVFIIKDHNMAADPARKELREINTRLKIKTEELTRLREEVTSLKEKRKILNETIKSSETT